MQYSGNMELPEMPKRHAGIIRPTLQAGGHRPHHGGLLPGRVGLENMHSTDVVFPPAESKRQYEYEHSP